MPTYVFTGSLTRPAPQYDLANGQGIGRYLFDDERGELQQIDVTGGVDDTAWLVVDPKRQRLYSTFEVSGANQSSVATFAIDGGAEQPLRPLGQQQVGGNEACHASLSRDGRFLLVASYNGANLEGFPDAALTVFPIDDDGALGAPVSSVRHEGSGPNQQRQLAAHAHCVVSNPAGDVVYVADLGIDRLVAYRFGRDGSLAAAPELNFAVPPGLGPRHLVFSHDGDRLFMVSELIPTVLSLAVDPETGALSQADSFSIPSLDGGVVQPSGIALTADGKHLFVGLRVCDEILGLRIGDDGTLTQTGRRKSGGRTPRDFVLSPSGRHLIVANQDSDRLTVFGVDPATGMLSEPRQHLDVGTPMSVKLAEF